MANRVSYWLGTTGPSYTLDSACSSSLLALEHAFRAMQDGQCDAAIVGGSNLCLHPYVSLQFHRLGIISLLPRLFKHIILYYKDLSQRLKFSLKRTQIV